MLPIELARILTSKVNLADMVHHRVEEAGVLPLLLGIHFERYLFVSLLSLPCLLDLLLLPGGCAEGAVVLAVAVSSCGCLAPAALAQRFLPVDVINGINCFGHLLLKLDLQCFSSLLLIHLLFQLVLLLLQLALRLVQLLKEATHIGGEVQFFANKEVAHGADQVLVVLVHLFLLGG